jgi:FdhE protein
MTAPIDTQLDELERQYPDWKPWLAVIEEVVQESTDPKWDSFVSMPSPALSKSVPLLSGATLVFDMNFVRSWTRRLMSTAYRTGTPNMATLKLMTAGRLDPSGLFKASLCQEIKRLRETAVELGVDPDALQAVAILVPVPFLHACRRRWASSRAESWAETYCPLCGAWPAFGEVRGIERSRYLRCGRCGGGWQVHCLLCPYCGMTDHNELVSLVPERSGSTSVIEACKRCLGYVKTFTTLQGNPAAKVIVEDLASVHLDIAAVEQGYKRPEGPGYAVDVTLLEQPRLKRIFPWSA